MYTDERHGEAVEAGTTSLPAPNRAFEFLAAVLIAFLAAFLGSA